MGNLRAWTVLAGVAAVVFAFLSWRGQDDLPELPDLDVREDGKTAETRIAGKAERIVGSVKMASSGNSSQSELLKSGEGFVLGTSFKVPRHSVAEILTEGNWRITLEGEGQFIFEDARTNSQRTRHSGTWTITKGTFRAKPRDYDPGEHYLRLKTPGAQVLLKKGEIGLRLSESGRGQVWLMSGEATVIWSDGRKSRLSPKGMAYL